MRQVWWTIRRHVNFVDKCIPSKYIPASGIPARRQKSEEEEHVTLSTKSIRLAALGAVAALAFGACSGTTASPAASTAGGSQAPSSAGASVAPSAAAGALPTPEQKSLKLGVSVTEMSQYAGPLAVQLGLFKKYGIDVEYSVFEGDARVAAALQAGQIQIGFSGTSSAISSQLTDVPYNVVGVLAVILTDDLVCKAGIDTAEEVKGKKIAISTFGGTSNAAALLALKALNLAANDAVITQVGGQSARLAALQGGSVDCAIIDSNVEDDMKAQGFSIATNLKTAGIPFGRSGMSVTTEFIKANPNTILVAVAAVLEAQNTIFSDSASVVPKYAEFTGKDAASAQKQVDDFVKIGNRSMLWTEEALKNPQKAIAVINPDIIDVDVNTVGNRTFLDTLAANGFYDKIGSPKP
jgi:ABC-type nitrate/sulfonate/bicarbonate transport system substrate-binding protein